MGKKELFGLLNAQLTNVYWSWGGTRSDGSIVFIGWAEEMERIPGSNLIRYCLWQYDKPRNSRPGAQERLRHVEDTLKHNRPAWLVFAKARDYDAEPRSIAFFQPDLIKVRLQREGDKVWATEIGKEAIPGLDSSHHWWVNQNQTYKHEISGNYLWSPKTKSDNSANPFYDNMLRVQPGDVVFSFADTLIKAVGVVTGYAESATKPDEFGSTGAQWGNEGWYVPVQFTELEQPIRPKDHIDQIAPTLPEKYAPIRTNGDGKQSVYLAEVPEAMASILKQLLDGQVGRITKSVDVVLEDKLDDVEEERIRIAQDIAETEKEQLVKSRRGQGLFKSRIETIEKGCRLTGVTDRSHLRASHIKPWRSCSNAEKLDGNNGLLLSPHVDHLFDRGFLSFEEDGKLMVSGRLNPEILSLWALDKIETGGSFNEGQKAYLDYHRKYVFRKS
ncbi:MAG: HNH endonuclease [Methylomicrobium sp.]